VRFDSLSRALVVSVPDFQSTVARSGSEDIGIPWVPNRRVDTTRVISKRTNRLLEVGMPKLEGVVPGSRNESFLKTICQLYKY